MKIDRLIGILSVLLQKDQMTAPQLAKLFEVSRRTINRDIESLCKAGIPILTRQGTNGGISIMAGYKIDRSLLTNAEMRDILAGLRSLDSVNGTNRYEQLMEKLSAGSSNLLAGDQSVLIDLSSWYKDSLAPKIALIRSGIDGGLLLEFEYFSPNGDSLRRIEPYFLIFRWSNWYVWGWCKTREAFRLFKLNRMDRLCLTDERFEKRAFSMPDLSNERIFPGSIKVKAVFAAECKWRLIEEFGPGSFEPLPDGKLLFSADYTDEENLMSWIMTFRDKAILLEPEALRRRLAEELKNMQKNYNEGF